ncbi:MAG TPA: Zn-dependent alcohol dehydrogenase [Candidatus Binataceae bacterium]|jgi:S-(hydroxymethyl)glutathione dehydrogenase/alcohol dehydrogenase|nr:Zn-dependent alcohol dehydrogenase [Candidatus Binataceae bacterium]
MKAAVFYGPNQPLKIEQVEIDAPQDREVLVRTVASGVCHSDLHFVDGLYPYPTPAILGHEAAGIVEQVGKAVTYLKPGDHVIACLSVFCGFCEDCMSGHPNRCANKEAIRRGKKEKSRLSQNGAPIKQFAELSTYAEKMLVHENALVKIDPKIPLDRAALVGCGVTTGMGAVLNTARIEPGSTVAVFGCGGVGLAAIQGARIAGARMIIAVDKFESKLALAKRLGATHTVDSSQADPVKAIRQLTNELAGGSGVEGGGGLMSPGNDGVDYAFEAVGIKELAEMCFEAVKPGGTATIIGMIPVGQKVAINGAKLLTERKLQGTNMGSNRFRIDMPRYLDYYQQGRLNLDDMITRRGRLEDITEAFRAMKAGEVARTVLMFD